MSVQTEATMKELDELQRLGVIGTQLHEKARAVVRDEGDGWEAMSVSEMADMAIDLARMRTTRR